MGRAIARDALILLGMGLLLRKSLLDPLLDALKASQIPKAIAPIKEGVQLAIATTRWWTCTI